MNELPPDLTLPGWFWAFLVSGMFVGALSVLSPRRASVREGSYIFAVSLIGLLLLLSVSVIPQASAQSSSCPASATPRCDQGVAYSSCMAGVPPSSTNTLIQCHLGAGQDHYVGNRCRPDGSSCSADPDWRWFFSTSLMCSDRPDEYGWAPPGGVAGGNVCSRGCAYTYVLDASAGNFFSPTGSVCTTTDAPEPVVDTDGDGVPDDDDAFPNDPNESADSDGDGIGDNADVAPDDPTNGDDDGEGNESDNSAGGGGTCDAPPSCEGDGIACNTNFQMWKARCAVEGLGGKVTGDPTNCNSGYTCENNAVACAQVAVMRAQLCSGTGDGEPGPGSVTGGGNCETPYVCTNGDPIACASLREQHKLRCDITANPGDDEWGFEGEPDEYFGVSESSSGAIDGIDADGWLNRGQCPLNTGAISALNLPGNAIELTCGSLSALGLLILMLGWVHAGMIVGRALSGSA